MRDETLLAMSNDPENFWEDGVLYGPGLDGDRVELISVNRKAAEDYVGPVPRWVTRRGLKLYDVVGSQYDTDEPAMVVTADGFRSVEGGAAYTWVDIMSDYEEDLDVFFDGFIKFTR